MSAFTWTHVVISLIGIGSGIVVIWGFVVGNRLHFWNALFLLATIATSVTGFFFPFKGVTPGIVLGVVSLIVLALALVALRKRWTKTYIVTVSIAEFLNVLVLIVQSFEKIGPLHMFAPTGKEPVVAVTQGVALIVFAVLAWVAIRRSAFVLV